MMSFKKSWTIAFIGLGFMVVGCGTSPSSSSGSAIKISIRTIAATNPSGNRAALQVQADSVTITSVRFVIDEIELESSLGDSLDFELEQPFVRDLMLSAGLQEIETVPVPAGSYKELEVEIDELNASDGPVYTANPELQDRSILVKGFFNNTPSDTFQFATDLEEEFEQEFDPPIVIDGTTPATNIVVTININSWFFDENGNLLDPRLPQNQSAIEGNIKKSIDAFEDKDDDGEDDDDEDDD